MVLFEWIGSDKVLLSILKGVIVIFIGFLFTLIFSATFSQYKDAGILFAILYLAGIISIYSNIILKKIEEKK